MVCTVEVGDEAEGCFEVLLDDIEAQFEGGEPLFDVVEFSADALLFDLEQVERDRVGVVGLEQLGSFIEGAPLSVDELLSFDARVLAELGDLFEDDLLGL